MIYFSEGIVLVFDKRIFHVTLEAVSGSIKTTSRKRDTIVIETREGQINDLWITLLIGHPTKKKLIKTIKDVPELRRDAWHELMRRERDTPLLTDEDFICLMDVAELREEIQQLLSKRGSLMGKEATARILPSLKGKILEWLGKPTASRQKR